jgi:hypothetical protein
MHQRSTGRRHPRGGHRREIGSCRRRKLGRWLPGAALFAGTAALLVAGCGGSSSTDAATHAQVAGVARNVSGGLAHRVAGQIHADPVHKGLVVQRPTRGTGGSEINDDNPGRADSGNGSQPGQLNPCTLVSKAQAQAIIGHQIEAPQEAPLGPTCIYQPVGAKSFVTITLEAIDFAKLEPELRDRKQLDVGGHAAYCGDYGQPTTFVPMGRGRVLSITAPCSVGARFAGEAVPRVPTPSG